MKPAHRLPALMVALVFALALLAVVSVGLVTATLEPAERTAVAAVLASRAMLVVMLWLGVFALAAWGLARLFSRFVEAPARLAEEAQVLLAGGAAREVEAQGSAANRGLADTLNALVRQRSQLQQDVARQVAEASHAIEQERSRLSALMAELTQAVLVCNLDGRILLYNSRARAQFRALSSTPSTAGGAELIGLGRSIHAVFERQLVTHALDTLKQRARAGVAQPSTQFVTSTRNGQLLRVQMAAVGDVPAKSTVPVAGGLQLTGFVLMLDDITRDFEQEAMRDRLLLGLTEGSRASLGNLQAAVEMLELPDLEAAMRERFQRVVRDEVATMTARVQSLAADVLAGMKTRWPMEEMLGADLVSAAARRIEAIGPVRVSTSDVDTALWLKVDSYSLLQALVCLAGRLVDEYEVKSLQLRLKAAGPRAQLDLVWVGQAMSTETVMNWQMDAMVLRNGSGADATPLTVRDVVERHGGEFWFERERVRHEAFFRFLLPCSAGQDRPAAAHATP
ncbi:MAG: DNA polymerase III subunit epsilon, partial [Bacteriovorax sp.]|nr:DNA polymerase III subunit epsilon [Rhizobacter sp.]